MSPPGTTFFGEPSAELTVGHSTPDSARSYSVGAFVLGTFAFAWAIWLGLTYAADRGLLSGDSPGNLYGWGGLGPSLVAFFLILRSEGLSGGKRFFGRLLRWRAPLRWYAFALLVPVLIRLMSLGLYAITGGSLLANPVPLATVVVAFLLGFVVALMEEFGWRGYMLPGLLARWPPHIAGLGVGAAWAAWHLPLFWIPGIGFYRWAQASGRPLAILGYSAAVVGLSMLFTLMYCRTDGNLLLAFLLHDAANTSSDVFFAPYQRLGITAPAWWSVVITVAAGAIAGLLLRRRPSGR
jgi:membrane protease YdiL (CAAX protease family)